MEKIVSICHRALILEEIGKSEDHFVDLFPLRHLSLSNASTDRQPVIQVVKVSGTVTISF